MPRVIKSQDLIVKDPVIIDPIIKEPILPIIRASGKTHADESKDVLTDEANDSFDTLIVREEADKILQETEQMVMDILEKARNEANHIITEAMEEAQDAKTQSLAEIETLRQNALDTGYREGWENAQQENDAERKRGIDESQRLIDEAVQERAAIITSSEEIIIRLSMAVAEKIIEKEIEQNPDIIINLVKNIIELMSDAESIKVLVNPVDYEILVKNHLKITAPGQGVAGIEFHGDDRITQGGCIVETELGAIDGQLETRTDNLQNALIEAAGGE